MSLNDSADLIQHVVLLKVRRGADPGAVDALVDAARDLADQIPEVATLSAGAHDAAVYPGYADRSKGFTHAIVGTFGCARDLQVYLDHPAHMRLVTQYILPIVDESVVLDYYRPRDD